MVSTAPHLALGEHVCVTYRSEAELRSIVEQFVAEARASGRLPLYFDRATAEQMLDDRPSVDPPGVVSDVVDRARAAVADGYAGLAVLVDATAEAATAETRRAFARVEHLADRAIHSTCIISGRCVYDARELDDDAVAELGVLHERLLPDDTPFHLHADAQGAIVLDGEIDLTSQQLFERTFDAVVSVSCGELVVDASGLEFLDLRSLYALDRRAAADERRIVVRGANPIVRRAIEVSGVVHVMTTDED